MSHEVHGDEASAVAALDERITLMRYTGPVSEEQVQRSTAAQEADRQRMPAKLARSR